MASPAKRTVISGTESIVVSGCGTGLFACETHPVNSTEIKNRKMVLRIGEFWINVLFLQQTNS